jgi:hypothetical protein
VAQFGEQRFRGSAAEAAPQPTMAIAMGDGKFDIEVVGTAEHQDTLERIAGGRTENGVDHLCGALLVPNPKNPVDPNAIAVVIDSHVIGFIPTPIAPSLKYALRVGEFIAAGCAARITGGWWRKDDIGPFSVRLDAEWPFKLRPIAKENPANPPAFLATQRAAPPPAAAVAPPPVEIRAFDDDRAPVEAEEPVMPRRRVSFLSLLLQVVLAAAILAVGYWWVQRLPREPADKSPAPPAQVVPKTTEPADTPQQQQPSASPFGAPPPPAAPFQWPDPPNFQTPPAAATPPVAAPPPPSPPAATPAPQPPPAEKQTAPEKKARPKTKAKTPAPNAPLKIN